MIEVQIGDQTVRVGPLPFAVLEVAWPYITGLSDPDMDRFARTTAHLSIVAAYLAMKDLPVEMDRPDKYAIEARVREWKRNMTWPEIMVMDQKIVEILHLSGFKPSEDPEPGEQAAATLSTATSSPLSPASPPTELKGEASTASIAA